MVLGLAMEDLWGALPHDLRSELPAVPALWRAAASDFTGRSLGCGHYIAEEAPALLLDETLNFFRSNP